MFNTGIETEPVFKVLMIVLILVLILVPILVLINVMVLDLITLLKSLPELAMKR